MNTNNGNKKRPKTAKNKNNNKGSNAGNKKGTKKKGNKMRVTITPSIHETKFTFNARDEYKHNGSHIKSKSHGNNMDAGTLDDLSLKSDDDDTKLTQKKHVRYIMIYIIYMFIYILCDKIIFVEEKLDFYAERSIKKFYKNCIYKYCK